MSTRYSGQIVVDGLVLALDASSPRSYPGSGTTWYDLSGNGNTGSFSEASIGTVSSSLKFLSCDGVNDLISVRSPYDFNESTLMIWVRPYESSKYMFGSQIVGPPYFQIYLRPDNKIQHEYSGSATNGQAMVSTNTMITGSWNFLSITMSETSGSVQIRVNNIEDSSAKTVGSMIPDSDIDIASYGTAMRMDVGSFTLYNRALSSAEVLQNYNATKGRFL